MTGFKVSAGAFFLAALGLSGNILTGFAEEKGFVSLFNGKDLSGWVNVNCAPSTWSINEAGLLACTGKPTGEIRTERMYQNFILELEWRHLKPKGNAGVFIWADDITARGQPFHRGIEVQVLENAYGNSRGHTTHGDIFPIHGAKMTPENGRGGGRAFPTESRSRPSPEWNHYRIICNDGNISLAVNGKVVTKGAECWPKKGYICLESEGGVVDYRNIKIRELPDTPIKPEDIAIANRGYRCLYSGVDLSGWKASSEGWKSRNWNLVFDGKGDSKQTLASDRSFGDFGFIVDVASKGDLSKVAIKLRGSDAGKIDLGNPEFKNFLEKPGRWNRLEGKIRGNQLTLSLNGKHIYSARKISDLPANGPMILEAPGPVQWANIYVRNLGKD